MSNGKGSSPRSNHSKRWRDNYDSIQWGSQRRSDTGKTVSQREGVSQLVTPKPPASPIPPEPLVSPIISEVATLHHDVEQPRLAVP